MDITARSRRGRLSCRSALQNLVVGALGAVLSQFAHAAPDIRTMEVPGVDGCLFVFETYAEYAELQAEQHRQSLWDGMCIDGKATGQGVRIKKIGDYGGSTSSLESRLDGLQMGLARSITHLSGELFSVDETYYDHWKRTAYGTNNVRTRLPAEWPPSDGTRGPKIYRYREGSGTVVLRLAKGISCKNENETVVEAANKMCMVRDDNDMANKTYQSKVIEHCTDGCVDLWIRSTAEMFDERDAYIAASDPTIRSAIAARLAKGGHKTTLAERMRAPGMAEKRAAWAEAVEKHVRATQAAKRKLRQDELEVAAAKRVVEDAKRAPSAPALRPAAEYPSMKCPELYKELHNISVRHLFLKDQAESKGFLSGLTTIATVIAFGVAETTSDVHKASAAGLSEALAGQAKVFDAEEGASENESVALEKRAKLMRQLIDASNCERQ